MSASYVRRAGRPVWRLAREYAPDLVGGLTMAADPLTVAVLYEAAAEGRPVGRFSVRTRRKRYGPRKLIEGQLVRAGASIVLVDDVMSSGRSLLRA